GRRKTSFTHPNNDRQMVDIGNQSCTALRQIIHVVPQLPPEVSGVGDYCALVARQMERASNVVCGFVAAGHQQRELPEHGVGVRNVSGKCDPVATWEAVESLVDEQKPAYVSVLLHYSGYGYERTGRPAWLVEWLRNRPMATVPIATYFHELYAT